MKFIKYIGIAILVILFITVGPALAMAFGACTFLGFIVLGGLDAIGLIKIPPEKNFNVIAGISFVLGLLIFLCYYGITGWPEN